MKRHLFLDFWKISIKSQMSYKKDFWVELFVWFLYSVIPFFTLALMLEKYGEIGGLTIGEIAVLYGISQLSYDLARMVGRGFDHFSEMVMSGDLDVFFIRPLGILYQIMVSELFLRRLSGIVQGTILIVIGGVSVHLFSLEGVAEIFVIIFSATVMYLALLIINAAFTFVTLKGNVLIGYFIDLTSQTGYYPLPALKNPIKFILMYIIPIGMCIYYPVMSVITAKNQLKSIGTSVAISTGTMAIAIVLFLLMRKEYRSANN